MIFRLLAYFINVFLCLAFLLVTLLLIVKCILRITMKVSSLSKVPLLEAESIDDFVKENNLPEGNESAKTGRRTRSLKKKVTDGIFVENVAINKETKSNVYSVEGVLKVIQQDSMAKPVAKGKKKKAPVEDVKPTVEIHNIRAEINESGDDIINAASCKQCKDKCPKIYAFLLWIQQRQAELEELENNQEISLKKIKRERNNDNVLKPVNIEPLPTLPKLKKENITTPSQVALESAQKLSLVNLIQEYNGQDPQQFLEFCGRRMQEENYSNAEILTVEQADTDLWHELRKGRITASRIHEASRCSMLRGSLCDKIMGIKSGFSFAMKRGTDLEGHVFAVLQKQYPSLRNAGLVLDPQFPWMGASPDGLADDFVLEIKCPYTPKTFEAYIDVTKLSKKYYAQIQLQMHMTHRSKALLGVAALDFERSRQVTQVWIDYDKQFVDSVMKEAFEFWRKGVFPALLRKRKSKK
uniref:Putative yqaj-like viral recombinase domain protein n=2 Tax=Culex tarsalis TaxID=7177 RepID=A0A1Q3EW73_CULTA